MEVKGDLNVTGNVTANNLSSNTLLQGVSTVLNGGLDLAGNTTYNADITVTGAVVGDKVSVGVSDTLASTLSTTNIRPAIFGWVTAADTVRVSISVSSFVPANAENKVWCRIVK